MNDVPNSVERNNVTNSVLGRDNSPFCVAKNSLPSGIENNVLNKGDSIASARLKRLLR